MTTDAVGQLYSLVDPRDGAVRYVGQTTKSLQARLAGHLASPSPKVALWIEELLNGGVTPQIESLREAVPVEALLDMERQEITRRIIAGEPLLNESATAPGRRVVQQRNTAAQAVRRQEAWLTAGQLVRSILKGPVAPGPLSPVPFPRSVWEALAELAECATTPDGAASLNGYSASVRWTVLKGRTSEALWEGCRGAWGRLRGSDSGIDGRLRALVSAALDTPWDDPGGAARYLSLTPWALLAVAPWAALAERGGLSLEPDAFIAWATDDPETQAALRDLSEPHPRVFKFLAAGEDPHGRTRGSTHLAAAVASEVGHSVAPEIADELTEFLRATARHQMLTPAMARLLAALDSGAMPEIFGHDLAAAADSELGLPPGTAVSVLRFILEHPKSGPLGTLDRLVIRASQELPSKPFPDYSTWTGPGVRIAQVVTVSLALEGLLVPPDGLSVEEVVGEVRDLWAADRSWLDDAEETTA